MLAIIWHTVYPNMAGEVNHVGRILHAGRLPDTCLSSTASNVLLLFIIGTGVTSYRNAASTDWGAFGGFPMTGTPFNAAEIQQPWRSICSWLLT